MIAISNLLMFPTAAAGAYYAYENSDAVGKFIVLLLLGGSILTWIIMLDKGMTVSKARKLSENFMRRFNNTNSLVALREEAKHEAAPLARIYSAGIETLMNFKNSADYNPQRYTTILTDPQIDAVRTVLEREVCSQVFSLENRVGVLATLVSVSPLCGLFGTVWGIMIAFCSLAADGRANIGALAPGISGALLTTVVGLIVAIPSVIGYNLIGIGIRKVTVNMDNFTEEFISKLKLEQIALSDEKNQNPPAGNQPAAGGNFNGGNFAQTNQFGINPNGGMRANSGNMTPRAVNNYADNSGNMRDRKSVV